ncbi:DNA-binding transcriptional LysR family regulator [Pseudomonas sp. URMO17WK12:I1]|uniref:LysR family transcriptional regulator n=1 Tax=unclassified Pseudomonas TaxID=196821 RepID=UPI000487D349|nr:MULTISPECIES: LysR family transcriptional regulator [unclassified Pseudomonas]PZW69756.1 DNA-binding transcriptional LysR family regulator [Pseudomonas sp. URMO17WK12:I1]
MTFDVSGEPGSQPRRARLPSLMALRCFEAAARLENFSQAAQELHLTHGAVSRAVRLLEDDLGMPLFERRRQRVFLNGAGRTLARAVGQGLDLMHEAVQALRDSVQQPRPAVLSCEPTLLMRWLIPRWSDFQALHSGLEPHLVAGGGTFSFEAGVDLAIRRDDFAWPASYHVEVLFAERIGLVCRPDKVSEWFTGSADALALSQAAPLLQTRTRPSAFQDWAQASGRPLPAGPARTFEHFYFSLQAAVAGLGVAIGPWHLVRDDIEAGLLAAPLGFVEDGSRYCLLAPRPIAAESLEARLVQWLRAQGA